jgi:UDP-N-acetylmuramoyl-L-alanyl-D-glutamate--2,6-diaminopimelate ligase
MIPEPIKVVSLTSLFDQFPLRVLAGNLIDVQISGIALDNRLVKQGDLFVAMKGSHADGHDYILDAVKRGAAAVVGDKTIANLSIPYMQVENSRQSLTWLAAKFYDNPGRKLTVIGVTGTDGKTTTCNLIFKILLAAGLKAGLISTVNVVIEDELIDSGFHVTTPDAPDVQRYLSRMVNAGITHVVLETTSHGWAQYRVDACEFDVGVVTNITHEHLDQHGSFENYRAAKARLLQSLQTTLTKAQGNPRLAVLNHNDSSFRYLSRIAGNPQVCYGFDRKSDLRAEDRKYSPGGINFVTVGKEFWVPVTSQLVGEYNVENCLAAMAAAIYGLGIAPEIAASGIASLSGIPGRMERIDLGQSFSAIVDFAHTPNALRVAIETARKMTEKKIIVIFGSAGLRDKEKRTLMAEVATELADISIFTAEDPRSEPVEEILEEMARGARNKGGKERKSFWQKPDRREAIRMGVRLAQTGDILMACGKGHEQSMCFGTTEYPWDDRIAMRAAIAELMGVPGPQMPFLPGQVNL